MKIIKVLGILVLIGGLTSFVFAEEVKRSAEIVKIKGGAEVKLTGEDKWVQAAPGMLLSEGDIIRTKKDSWVLLNVSDAGTVEIEEESQLMLTELVKDEEAGTQKTLLDLAIGEILIKAQKLHTPESRFEVKTPTSVVGVRGTKFSVKVEALE